MLNGVDEYDLPTLYGGLCDCKATCVYSEKGPWSEVENLVNYQEPQYSDDEEDIADEFHSKKKKNQKIIANFGNSEEFKMVEDEDDYVDLLKEKQRSKNHDEFY